MQSDNQTQDRQQTPGQNESPQADSEFARIEALLFARTRSYAELQREHERRDRLLREGLDRISNTVSTELSTLRVGYDAAVARAIEAEVARAELTFALDELRTQLTAASAAGGASRLTAASVRDRLGEPDQTSARPRHTVHTGTGQLERELASAQSQLASERAEHFARFEGMRGEQAGLRARLAEAELSWQAAHARTQQLAQRLSATQERVEEVRAENAELRLLSHSRAARIAELTQSLATGQHELRNLHAQVAAASAAQVAQGEAREADRQLWAERLKQHDTREQEAWSTAASAVARAEERQREFLASLERSLRQLDASLDAMGAAALEKEDASRSALGHLQPAQQLEQAPLAGAKVTDAQAAPHDEGEPVTRITQELARERERRAKLAATVRALRAASQSGESTSPWIEELSALLDEASTGAVAIREGTHRSSSRD